MHLQFPSFKKQAEELASYCITDASICELHRFTRDDNATQMELVFPSAKAKLRVNEILYRRRLMFHWWQNTAFLVSLGWFKNLERNRNMDLFSPPYFVPPFTLWKLVFGFCVLHLYHSSPHSVSVPPRSLLCFSPFAQSSLVSCLLIFSSASLSLQHKSLFPYQPLCSN